MKSQKSYDRTSNRKKRPRGTVVRPLLTTLKQTVKTTPIIRRLVPGGRKPVTFLYPYEKLELFKSYRGQHSIDWFKCIGCELCAKVCPNECIYFETIKMEENSPYLLSKRSKMDTIKKQIKRPAVDVGHCLFCGDCAEYCPTDAWTFLQECELADYTREDLFYHSDELKKPDELSDRKQVLYNRQGDEPILDVDACIGCLRCDRECPTGCISMTNGPNLRKDKPIPIPEFNYTVCIGCQQCVDVCPANCLHMEEIHYETTEIFYNVNFRGETHLLEDWVPKKVTNLKMSVSTPKTDSVKTPPPPTA